MLFVDGNDPRTPTLVPFGCGECQKSGDKINDYVWSLRPDLAVSRKVSVRSAPAFAVISFSNAHYS